MVEALGEPLFSAVHARKLDQEQNKGKKEKEKDKKETQHKPFKKKIR